MTTRWIIESRVLSTPDALGRTHNERIVTDSKTGRVSYYTGFSDADEALRRLRSNIAKQFWFDRYRVRMAQEAQAA